MMKNKSEIYKSELLRIKETKRLTPENIVEEARSKKSPLHDFFEWDNSLASDKWRIHQARLLVNCIIIKAPDETESTAEFEIISDSEGKEYKHISEILSNEEWKQQVLLQSLVYLKSWRKKYEIYNIKDLIKISKEITSLEKKYLKPKKKQTIKKQTIKKLSYNNENENEKERRTSIGVTA